MSHFKPKDDRASIYPNPRDYVLYERGNRHLHVGKRGWRDLRRLSPLVACALAAACAGAALCYMAVTNRDVQAFQYLLIAVTVTVLVLWLIPKWQTRHLTHVSPEARFDKENEGRRTLAQFVAGLAFFGGLYSAFSTYQVTRDGQITDRFTKAITQLDSKNSIETRLGGIYALERIAQESERDHWPIMEVLTAYVREHARRRTPAEEKKEQKSPFPPRPRDDIQAVLTVIGRRSPERVRHDVQNSHWLNLGNTDLRGALLNGARLDQTVFVYSRLDGAHLFNARLHNVDFTFASLENAYLMDAIVPNARFFGTRLNGANLEGVQLLHDVQLTSAVCGEAGEGEFRRKTVLPAPFECPGLEQPVRRYPPELPYTPLRTLPN